MDGALKYITDVMKVFSNVLSRPFYIFMHSFLAVPDKKNNKDSFENNSQLDCDSKDHHPEKEEGN